MGTKTSASEEKDRLRDNLKRMGCYLILYSYEELKRWIRPREEYSDQQRRQLKSENPLEEVKIFFFEPNGVEVVIETFEISLSLALVRKVAGKMIKQAEACIAGQKIRSDISDEAWELLVTTMAAQSEEE